MYFKRNFFEVKIFEHVCEQYDNLTAPSKDSNQPGHLPDLISLCLKAQCSAKNPSFPHVLREESYQTGPDVQAALCNCWVQSQIFIPPPPLANFICGG